MSTNKRRPDFSNEINLRKKGYARIAGVDEVGRGPLAGKITAAAVIFPAAIYNLSGFTPGNPIYEINDSKKLTPKKREELYEFLTKNQKIKWAVASVSAKIIDRIGIHKATRLAMLRAVKKINPCPDFVIFDGKRFDGKKDTNGKKSGKRKKSYNRIFIIKADEQIMSCAAASIIAKVTRDRAMLMLHKKYPQYGFDKHKGYGTKTHMRILRKHGPCAIHRKSFAPCKNNYFC